MRRRRKKGRNWARHGEVTLSIVEEPVERIPKIGAVQFLIGSFPPTVSDIFGWKTGRWNRGIETDK